MDSIQKIDYADKIIENIAASLEVEQKEAIEIFEYLLSNRDLLSENELLKEINVKNENEKGLLVANGLYHINIKAATLSFIAKLLDSTVTRGYAAKAIGIMGGNKRIIAKIVSENGELCILKEILLRKDKMGNREILEKNRNECVNNNINCDFRKEDKCLCTADDIDGILERLESLGICVKVKNGFYKYTL